MGLDILQSLEVSSGLSIANSLDINIGSDALEPVPEPQNLAVQVTGYNESPLRYDTSISWNAPDEAVDSYEWRADNSLTWSPINTRSIVRSFDNTSAWVEVRSVKDDRRSSPIRTNFSEFNFPAINAPTGLHLEVTSHDSTYTYFTFRYNAPTNAWGRNVDYSIDRSGFGSVSESDTELRSGLPIPLSRVSYFSVRARTGNMESAWARINRADFIVPTISVPTGVIVTITESTAQATNFDVVWTAPSDVNGRSVTYETEFNSYGVMTQTGTSASYNYILPLSGFSRFQIRATTPDGAISDWVEVLAAEFVTPETGKILVLNNNILVINNNILHIAIE